MTDAGGRAHGRSGTARVYLGVDVGTTAVKVLALDDVGDVPVVVERPHTLHPGPEGAQEIDPGAVLRSVAELVAEAAAACAKAGLEVAALSTSILGEAFVLIDDAGRCIGRSPVAMDRRGLPHLDEFRERFGEEEIARRTGQPVHPMYTATKLAHWRTRRVDEFRRTRSVLDWQAFLNRWLCGEPVTDRSLATRLLLYDPFEGAWWNAMLDTLELSAGQLPEVREAGAVAGHLRRDRAEELGLRPGLPVRVGAWDQACAALAGGVRPGVLMDSLGTTQAVIASAPATPSIEATLRYGYQRTPAATPGGWLLVGGSLSGALVLRWLLERVAGAGAPPLADLLQSAGADPASVLVLPHLTGAGTPHPDPAARAVILGADFDTSLADLVVGALDGVYYEARANIDAMRSVGVRIDRVHVTGGLSRHLPALQRKADAYGLPVAPLQHAHGSAYGAAMLAAGERADGDTQAWSAPDAAVVPDAARARAHDRRYVWHRNLAAALKPVFADMQATLDGAPTGTDGV